MRRNHRWIALATCALALVGCAERAARPADKSAGAASAPEEKAADAPTPPPADSKLAKVTKGMTMSEVVKILGEPTDRHQYVTGKAFTIWNWPSSSTWGHPAGTAMIRRTGWARAAMTAWTANWATWPAIS